VNASSLRLVELGPDDTHFADWCEVWAAGGRLDRPDDPPRTVQEHAAFGRALVAPGGSRDGTHRAAVVDGGVAGALRLILPMLDNPSVAYVDVAVHPAFRRRGIGSALLAEGIALAAVRGRSRFVSDVDEPGPGTAGRAFALRHGWTCDLVETRRDLVLPVDEQRLSTLEAEAAQKSAGYDVFTWRDRVPDEFLEDRALLTRRITTDAPSGDVPTEEENWDGARWREHEATSLARGRTVLSAGAARDGHLVAFTDLHVPLADPRRAQQEGTLVLREHRGHRLGARLKAAVLREVAAEFPGLRRISTYNFEGNRPMVAVNEALGFQPAGQLSTWSTQL
jgi:GNAT superfamily N-acetyltransferase